RQGAGGKVVIVVRLFRRARHVAEGDGDGLFGGGGGNDRQHDGGIGIAFGPCRGERPVGEAEGDGVIVFDHARGARLGDRGVRGVAQHERERFIGFVSDVAIDEHRDGGGGGVWLEGQRAGGGRVVGEEAATGRAAGARGAGAVGGRELDRDRIWI